MDLVLQRLQLKPTGIFGSLVSSDNVIAVTLEHAYLVSESWQPKLPVGVYTCRRGLHQLDGMKSPFETFEVTDVPGHSGILFHVGNFNRDSHGCVLLGLAMIDDGRGEMISESKIAFQKFMQLQGREDSFRLTVCEDPRGQR